MILNLPHAEELWCVGRLVATAPSRLRRNFCEHWTHGLCCPLTTWNVLTRMLLRSSWRGYDIVFYCAPLTLSFHRYASVNLIWFVFAILASRCAGRCRHWYYCLSFLDGVRSGTVNVLDSLFFCFSTVSDSFFVFSCWAVLSRSGALQLERYSCFFFFSLARVVFARFWVVRTFVFFSIYLCAYSTCCMSVLVFVL